MSKRSLRIVPGILVCALLCVGAESALAAPATIQNDVFWKDDAGKFLYSQGGGVLKVGATYYWYGVHYPNSNSYASDPISAKGTTVTCYSSTDLAHWKFEGDALAANQTGGGWLGRVGVVYNATTKKYVMVGQGSSPSGVAGVYFAASSSPTGPFIYANVQSDIPFIVNGGTGDQTVFQDDDGKAYVICSSTSGRSNLYVAPLRTSDFLSIASATRIFGGKGREGNCLFKYSGRYYFCSSDLHGWNSSHTYVISASSILGPYGPESVMAGTDADFSHVTQTGFFITVNGTSQSTVIFAGDRWSNNAGNGVGFNQWCPLSFNGTTPFFNSLSQWNLDAATGTWTVGSGNNWVLNPTFEADRVAQTTVAGWTYTPASTASINPKDPRTGKFAVTVTGNATLSQAIKVPNGTYSLSVWAKSSGGQTACNVYAKGFGGTDKTASLIAAGSSWKQISIPGIVVSNGSIEVGIASTASATQWARADDFVLVRTDATEISSQNRTSAPITGPSILKVQGGSSFALPGGASRGSVEIFDLSGQLRTRFEVDHAVVDLRDRGFSDGVFLARISSR